jgi:hypothetical protein
MDLICVEDGQQVLEKFGFSVENFNFDIFSMIIVYFLFHSIAYIFLLKYVNK